MVRNSHSLFVCWIAALLLLLMQSAAQAQPDSTPITLATEQVDRIVYVANAMFKLDERDQQEFTAIAVFINKAYANNPNASPGLLQRIVLQARNRYDRRYRSSLFPGTYRFYMSPFDVLANMFNTLATQPGNPVAGAMLSESVGFATRIGNRLGQDTDWLEMSNAVGRQRASGGYEEYRNVTFEDLHRLARSNASARALADALFSRIFNARTDQAALTIKNNNPTFSQNPNILPIVSLIRPDGTILTTLGAARDIVRSFYQRMAAVVDGNLNVLAQVTALQTNYAASFYAPNFVTTIQPTIQTQLDTNRAVLTSAATAAYIVPFTMAPDARFVAYKQTAATLRFSARVATTAGEALAAVQAGVDAKPFGATGAGFKAAAGVLDAAAGAMDLAATFGTYGKSTEGAILDGVNMLSQQLADVQAQLNERLDRIDQNILTMYTEMNQQFAQVNSLLLDIGAGIDDLRERTRAMQTSLLQIQAGVDRLTQNIFLFAQQSGRETLQEYLAEADNYARSDLSILQADYLRIYSLAQLFATTRSRTLLGEVGEPVTARLYDDYSIARELTSQTNPELNINYLMELARVRFNVRQFPGVTLAGMAFPGDTAFTQIAPLSQTGLNIPNPKSWEMSVAGMLRIAAHSQDKHEQDPVNDNHFVNTTINDTAQNNGGFFGAREAGRAIQRAVGACAVQGSVRSALFPNLILNHQLKADRLSFMLQQLENEGGQSWDNPSQRQAIVDRIKAAFATTIPTGNSYLLQQEARAFNGAFLMIASFVEFGLSRTLESNDLLKSLLFSDQKLPDDALVQNLYFNWTPTLSVLARAAGENPRATFLAFLAERKRALTQIITNSLNESEATAQLGIRIGEPLASIDAMIQRMEAVTMPRVQGRVRAAQGSLIPGEIITLLFTGSNASYEVPVILDTEGYFNIAIPDDTYTLNVRATRFLRRRFVEPLVMSFGSIPGSSNNVTIDLQLKVGDINGDNIVDSRDLIRLRNAYGSTPTARNWDPAADLNGDGRVDQADMNLLRINWAVKGD